MMKVLDLFSGIGGFSLGLEMTGGFETAAFCECEPYAQKVLRKHWPDVPIYDDVRTLEYDGPVDLICGGYPCQPFSVAGRRKGAEDDRHLWPAMFALIESHRPAWVVGENVAGHISMGLDEVLSDLEALGYSARPFVIPAVAVDAPHRRDRVWILAHATELHRDVRNEYCAPCKRQIPKSGTFSCTESVANAKRQRQPRQGTYRNAIDQTETGKRQATELVNGGFREKWLPEPELGRVANGIPRRVDRLRCLGNTVVPQVVERIGYAILKAEGLK